MPADRVPDSAHQGDKHHRSCRHCKGGAAMTNTDNIARFAHDKTQEIISAFLKGHISWCADQIAEMGPSLTALVILGMWESNAIGAGDRRVLRSLLCDHCAAAGMFIAPDSLLETDR